MREVLPPIERGIPPVERPLATGDRPPRRDRQEKPPSPPSHRGGDRVTISPEARRLAAWQKQREQEINPDDKQQ